MAQTFLSGCVYDPPIHGTPFLAVIFNADGVYIAARPFPTGDLAQHFLDQFMQGIVDDKADVADLFITKTY
ncbi:hypothetical protein [Burkholderia vietnamiensis]|uniref:hypothetical protein n=1 Tax=Burkholderia vietnamiensis TaxID=60552 RepID=UPI001CB21FFA|nr:hypothetical protein [Burkholderia vietnamiensis]CAG9200834.1 hypothetical protein BVI434_1660030 [Burkholderia vietnamiensis]